MSLKFSDAQGSFLYNLAKEKHRSFRLQCMDIILFVMGEYGFVEDEYSQLMELSKGLKQGKYEQSTIEVRQPTETMQGC